MKRFFAIFPALFLILVLLDGCRTRPSFDFGAYSEAERFFEEKKYDKAIEKYEAYLRENPEGNMAVISSYYMAKSYEGLGDAKKAREIYRKIIKQYPELIWADFSKSRLQESEPSR